MTAKKHKYYYQHYHHLQKYKLKHQQNAEQSRYNEIQHKPKVINITLPVTYVQYIQLAFHRTAAVRAAVDVVTSLDRVLRTATDNGMLH